MGEVIQGIPIERVVIGADINGQMVEGNRSGVQGRDGEGLSNCKFVAGKNVVRQYVG